MDCLKKGVEAKMNDMEAKMDDLKIDLKIDMEELKINMNKLLQERVTKGERVVKRKLMIRTKEMLIMIP